MTVVDASVLIAHLDSNDAHNQRAAQILERVVPGGIGASPLTLAEVLVVPARAGQLDRVMSALTALKVELIPLPPDAPERLALLRASTNLKLPDCCVLLAATTSRSDIASIDERLVTEAMQLGLSTISV